MIFDKHYERADFIKILQTKILPGFVVDTRHIAVSRKTKFVEEGVMQLGMMKFSDGVEVPVRELEQQSSNDPRISVTKDAFKLLHDHQKDNALIVFWNKGSNSWRISLLTSTYEWWSKTNSNPKRYSFLLWVGEKTKTPQKYLIDKWPIKNLDDLVERFNVEVVRKEFFKLYINLFLELYSTIKSNPTFQVLIDHKKIEPVSFAKNLMGKMIFLYFIQKKWWLGIDDANQAFGTGDRDFFKNNFDKLAHDADLFQKHTNFYNNFLEPLFYSGLNKKNTNDWHDTLQMKVPYLNGGLFEEEYDRKHTIINLDNEVFKNIINSFNTYNFTIDEDDAHDREIAVDPEMLGKIFESMISVSKDNIDEILDVYHKAKAKKNITHPSPETILNIDIGKEINKKFGAFYTPREIVNYMTKESLIAHIVTQLHAKNTAVAESDLDVLVRKLFDYKEKHLSKSEIDADKLDAYESLKRYVFDIQEILKTLKILDPAVGSGAFPMGILQEVLGLRRYLIDTFDLKEESDFAIKKQIIQDTIYGVDIDPGAIDIARLRFWLSLIVDASEPVPLPNLDFKFVCANTLIPLEKNDSLFTASDIIMDLKALRLQYFASTSSEEKEELKRQFKSLQMALSWFGQKARHDMSTKEWKKYVEDLVKQNTDAKNRQVMERDPFDSSKSNGWFDSGMMFGVDGFDIVIGNPPYVNIVNLDKKSRDAYSGLYSITRNKVDLYAYFIEKFVIWNNWILNLIVSNTWLTTDSFKLLRKLLISRGCFAYFVDVPNGAFENANVETVVFSYKNQSISSCKDINVFAYDIESKSFDTRMKIKHSEILNNHSNSIILRMNEGEAIIVQKLKNNVIPLSNIMHFSRWIKTSNDNKFVVSAKNNNDCYPLLRGKNIQRYVINYEGLRIRYRPDLMKEKTWCLPHTKESFIVEEKIILQWRSGKNLIWTYDNNNFFVLDTTYFWKKLTDQFSIKYILAIINSKLINFRYWIQFPTATISWYELHQIPIKPVSKDDEKKLIFFVDQILAEKKADPNANTRDLEKQIDQMVYELYWLTPEEIAVVEGSV